MAEDKDRASAFPCSCTESNGRYIFCKKRQGLVMSTWQGGTVRGQALVHNQAKGYGVSALPPRCR